MTQLQLMKHDLNNGDINQIVAVSTSYSALEKHCKEKYNGIIAGPDVGGDGETYYTITKTRINIVSEL